MEPLRPTPVVRFGTFEASFHSGELRKAGLKIKVQRQPLKLLEILLERPGEVVSRDELRSRIWPSESFGDFDQALNIAIAKLRNALGDAAENPRFIETLPKRGYRFLADVSVADADVRPRTSESVDRDRSGTQSGLQVQNGGLTQPPSASRRQFWSVRQMIFTVVLVLGLPILVVWSFRSGGAVQIISCAAARQSLRRSFTGLLRRWHDR